MKRPWHALRPPRALRFLPIYQLALRPVPRPMKRYRHALQLMTIYQLVLRPMPSKTKSGSRRPMHALRWSRRPRRRLFQRRCTLGSLAWLHVRLRLIFHESIPCRKIVLGPLLDPLVLICCLHLWALMPLFRILLTLWWILLETIIFKMTLSVLRMEN